MSPQVLIVYYSLTGNTRFIAEAIKDATNGTLLEIKPKKDFKPGKFSTYMWGGYKAVMAKKPSLEPYTVEIDKYDLIFIGSPVWAWTLSPPLRTFIDQTPLKEKKIALWACADGNGVKAMERYKEAFEMCNIISSSIYRDPLKHDSSGAKERAQAWARECLTKI